MISGFMKCIFGRRKAITKNVFEMAFVLRDKKLCFKIFADGIYCLIDKFIRSQ